MVVDLQHEWILDLSHVPVSDDLLSKISGDVFNIKGGSVGSHNISICDFSHCR